MSDINPVSGQPRQPAHRALRFLAQERWAILPESLQLIRDIAAREHVPDFEAVMAKRGTRIEDGARTIIRGRTAVVPVVGPVFRYSNLITEFSGATSIAMLAREFRAALDKPEIQTVVMEINSPGGMITGVSEFAQMVRSSNKKVIAYIDGMGASAAYWIASAADEIVMNDTAQVGSIGVVTSFWIDEDDELVEIVSSQSPNKRTDPRTEEGRALIQRDTDELAQIFIDTVGAHRGVSAEKVMTEFGRGGLLIGQSAVKIGMADRLGSLEGLLAELAGPTASNSSKRSISMSTKKGPVTVASTAELNAAFTNGHTLDEISIRDFSADISKAKADGVAEGEKGKAEAVTAARIEGATAERDRIKAVEGTILPGHEALIATLKFDGKTTGPEAAAQVITAERQKLGKRADDIVADAAAARTTTTAAPSDAAAAAKPKIDPNLPVEDRCKAEWQHDPQLRADFGSVEEYIAYTKATEAGHVRVLRERISKSA